MRIGDWSSDVCSSDLSLRSISPFHAIGLAWAFATTSGASAMSKPSDKPKPTHLTTQFGAPVPNNQDSLTAGPRGPLLSQDVWLHEKIGNFVREVIPERRMHAKGSGAFGTFTVTKNIRKSTRAAIFSKVGKKHV